MGRPALLAGAPTLEALSLEPLAVLVAGDLLPPLLYNRAHSLPFPNPRDAVKRPPAASESGGIRPARDPSRRCKQTPLGHPRGTGTLYHSPKTGARAASLASVIHV